MTEENEILFEIQRLFCKFFKKLAVEDRDENSNNKMGLRFLGIQKGF